jgi:exopolyphosphatase/guanosine-5'-triphosphate,3'-diphosphate pyrophosphatase
MRVGVLDIGSNTGHLLVVDAHGGAAPLPASSFKQALRLAEHLDDRGAVTQVRPRRRGPRVRGDARLRDLGGP